MSSITTEHPNFTLSNVDDRRRNIGDTPGRERHTPGRERRVNNLISSKLTFKKIEPKEKDNDWSKWMRTKTPFTQSEIERIQSVNSSEWKNINTVQKSSFS